MRRTIVALVALVGASLAPLSTARADDVTVQGESAKGKASSHVSKRDLEERLPRSAPDALRYELRAFGIPAQVHDPFALPGEARHEYGIDLVEDAALLPADAVILAVAHKEYVAAGWPLVTRHLKGGKGIVMDVKAKLDRAAKPEGVTLWRL